MRKFKSAIIFYIFFSITTLTASYSQSIASDSGQVNTHHHKTIMQTLGGDVLIALKDWGKYLTYPLHMSGGDWMIGTGAFAAGLLISLADKKVTQQISRGGSADYHGDFWDFPTAYGYVLYSGAAAFGAYILGLITPDDKLRITGRMLIESVGYSGSLSYLCKFSIGRERPYISDNQYRFRAFKTNPDYQSLPSGHTTFAFALSTVMAERIDTWWSRVLFYSLAGMTAYARIRNNDHWLSDTFFGGLLGFSSGWFVVHNENNRSKSQDKKGKSGGKLSLSPTPGGLNLSYAF
jgi:membrane-associated phospholipid phosphatase